MFIAVCGRYISIQGETVLNRKETKKEECKEGCRERCIHNLMSLVSGLSAFHKQYNRLDPATGWILNH